MKRTKANKGITLMMLIITVAVLLILTLVIISTVSQNNILSKAQDEVDEFQILNEKEKIENELLAWKTININGMPTLENYFKGIYGEENVKLNVNNSITITVSTGSKYIISENNEVNYMDSTFSEPEKTNISVTLDKTTITKEITHGEFETEVLTATLTNASGALVWLSSDSDIAEIATSIGNKRVIKLKKAGTATISVAYKDNVNIGATCSVTVTEKEITLTINPTTINERIASGDTITKTLTATLANASGNLNWSSSNPSIAYLKKTSGNSIEVVLKKSGTANITVSFEDIVSAICIINVKEKNAIKVGSYVDYDIPYTDMFDDVSYTSLNGWRYIGKDHYGNYLIVSAGCPATVSTAYYSQLSSEFENISYIKSTSVSTTQNNFKKVGMMLIGKNVKLNFRASGISINEVHNLTLAELNNAVNLILGTERGSDETSSSDLNTLTDEAVGLFDLQGLEGGYKSAYYYWLVNENLSESYVFGGVALKNKTIQSYSSVSAAIGVRPVVVLDSSLELDDTDEDGIYEIIE